MHLIKKYALYLQQTFSGGLVEFGHLLPSRTQFINSGICQRHCTALHTLQCIEINISNESQVFGLIQYWVESSMYEASKGTDGRYMSTYKICPWGTWYLLGHNIIINQRPRLALWHHICKEKRHEIEPLNLSYLTSQGSMSLTIRTFFLAVLKYLEKDSFSWDRWRCILVELYPYQKLRNKHICKISCQFE